MSKISQEQVYVSWPPPATTYAHPLVWKHCGVGHRTTQQRQTELDKEEEEVDKQRVK